MNVSPSELDNMDASEIGWLFGWLKKHLEDSKKQLENLSRSKR